MGNDYIARKRRRKLKEGDAPKRIRKKKNQPRRLCRGPCFKPPELELDSSDEDMIASTEKKRRILVEKEDIAGNSEPIGSGIVKSAARISSKSKSELNEKDGHANATEGERKKVPIPGLVQHFLSMENIASPLPLQRIVWPLAVKGINLHVTAQPGSGKTLAYLLPVACKLEQQGHTMKTKPDNPLVLVLLPTRELAQQVAMVCRKVRKHCATLRVACLTGGSEKGKQIDSLKRRPHAIVATPGRLVDLLEEGSVSLDSIDTVILDEADKMLSLGFSDQLGKIKKCIEQSGGQFGTVMRPELSALLNSKFDENSDSEEPGRQIQVGLYSATCPASVSNMIKTWCPKAKEINMSNIQESRDHIKERKDGHDKGARISESVVQVVHVCAEHKKLFKLRKHLKNIDECSRDERHKPRVLIFANRIKTVQYVAKELEGDGRKVVELHGDKLQEERERAVSDFKSGKMNILVASDVAARGLHIKNLQYVVNFDFPSNLETYIHRVGRTGRVGAKGHAYSFLTRSMASLAPPLLRLLESHQQEIDPNLAKLAEAYAIAAQKLKESGEDVPDFRSDAEKRIRERVLKKRKKGVLKEDNEKVVQQVPEQDDANKKSSKQSQDGRKVAHMLPGHRKRLQRRDIIGYDSSSDTGDDSMVKHDSVEPLTSSFSIQHRGKRKSLPGRIRKKLANKGITPKTY